ncbi:M48 family metalloprotease [Flavobacterium sp. GA093]|uniref:M48 family metalloprotease n=1 Tax=Flavobacterium hydrocarbonoxydans TaxID=2683249 RepID=A0A6I4NE88_9FLAO|nr:M48 family metalloprotease [Flavobacterium hydrocarbonoxydans]MWB92926.1 M48 family metalloprotease [Flavobacterium hydrocarbonoxydans]
MKIKKKLPWSLLLFFSSCCIISAQELFVRDGYCSYSAETESNGDIYTFSSDEEANKAVERILKYTGLKKNFTIKAANVNNAEASIMGNTRYILYNQDFMLRVKKVTHTDWAAISIMAHEIGHHLQGHTLLNGGSRPNIELEADKYSGFILQKMGATLEQAKAAILSIASEQGSDTHPGKTARVAAITNGWIEARDLTSPPDTDKTPDTDPVHQPADTSSRLPSTPTPAVFYVSRCVFANDPTAYYVTNTNIIITINQFGQVAVVGQKLPPTFPNFAWMYQTAYTTYGVAPNGFIFGSYPNGTLMQVGYVTNP